MPIYEYECLKCGSHTEAMQKIADKPLKKCEKCGGKLEKQWSLSGFQFKGEGWYVTDYAGKKEGAKEEIKTAQSETSDTSESKEDKPADNKEKKTESKKENKKEKKKTRKNRPHRRLEELRNEKASRRNKQYYFSKSVVSYALCFMSGVGFGIGSVR